MKALVFLFIMVMLVECKPPIENATRFENNDTIIGYRSESNGLAEIKLFLLKDNSFTFYLRIIPQPMSDDEDSCIHSTGIWNKNKNFVRLNFIKKGPSTYALFDTNYSKKNEFNIINDSTVEINYKLSSINIWGVVCDKMEYKNAP
jgi:hypothetical protein